MKGAFMRSLFSISLTLVMALAFSGNTATISGTVTSNANGDSLSGVILVLTLNATPRTAVDTVISTTAGAYTFPDVDQGEYIISASKTGFVSATKHVRISGLNQTVTSDMELIPIGQGNVGVIRGIVRDSATNQPIQGATLVLSIRGSSGQGGGAVPVDTVVTSAAGSYLFSGISLSSRYRITAIAAGYAPQSENQITAGENDTAVVDFRLVALSGAKSRIYGTVKDSISSATVAGAQVVLQFGIPGGGGPGGGSVIWCAVDTAATASNGAFTFDGLAPNSSGNFYSIVVSASGYRTWSSDNITMDAGETDTIKVLLRRLNTPVSGPVAAKKGTTVSVACLSGFLIVNSTINDVTVSAFTLAGREVLRKSIHTGTNRIAISSSRNISGNTLVVSARASNYHVVRKITMDR
jgi:hypothetical protein